MAFNGFIPHGHGGQSSPFSSGMPGFNMGGPSPMRGPYGNNMMPGMFNQNGHDHHYDEHMHAGGSPYGPSQGMKR
jgi:hypothetical protein